MSNFTSVPQEVRTTQTLVRLFEICLNVHLVLICRVYICNLICKILPESSQLGFGVNESRRAGLELAETSGLTGASEGPQDVREDLNRQSARGMTRAYIKG